MQYSDDDVSVSGSEDDQHSFDSDQEFGDEEDVDLSNEGVADEDADDPAAAAAATAAAAAGLPGSGKASSRDVTDALMSGQLSTQTALLQMELSELLSEISSARQQGKQAVVYAAVAALQAALTSLPQTQLSAATAASAPGSVGAAAALEGLVGNLGPDAQAVSLSVGPPSRVALVGSWADGTAARLAGGCVDVAVQIPSSCMHHKDHLNYRYHAKRAMYLSQLSSHLSAHPVFSTAQQQLSAFQGDPFRPALLLQLGPAALSQLLQQQPAHKPARSGSTAAASAAAFGTAGLVLRLLPTVGLDCFELAKLAPSRNNIRWVTASSSFSTTAAVGGKSPAQGTATPQGPKPTPHYNAGILQDVLLLVNSHKQQQAALAGGTKFVDALLLLKVWAQQHGLSTQGVLPPVQYACSGPQQQQAGGMLAAPAAAAVAAAQADGFSGFLLSALLTAAVQKTGEAAASMSSLQLFRTALQLLADQKQWVKGAGVGLSRDNSVPSTLHQRQQQQQQAAAAEGKVSKDHAKLLQKLQQQQQSLPAPAEPTAAFKKAYGVTFLDGSGHLNLAAAVSNAQMQLAQAAAQRSLNLLNRHDLESDVVYAAVFKPGQGLNGVFHYFWSVEVPEQQQQQLPGDQHSMRLSEVEVEGLVRSALGSRARLVKALRRSPLLLNPTSNNDQQQQQQHKRAKHSHGQQQKQQASAASSSSSGSIGVPRRIVVCAVVDPAAVLRLVDVGPAADDAAAAGKYRKLWGDKSELRRFQDGKICEAVVWEGVPVGQRHQIPDLAVAHVLQRHLPAGTVITSCATALDPLLYASSIGRDAAAVDHMQWTPAAAAAAGAGAGAGGSNSSNSSSSRSVAVSIGSSSSTSTAAAEETAASRAADAALDALTKQLRALNDLALKVIGVQPLSSVTRHTCCFYPEPHPLAEGAGARAYTPGAKVPRVLETIDVMVQLESTGKMPLHPEAYAKTKAALGVQLSSALSSASGAFVTATEEALEVLWQGFAFKLILYLDRDEALSGAPLVTANGSSSNGSSSSGGSSGHQALPVLLSQHHGLVSALAAAHPAYGPTVRLAKRWMGTHLLLGGQVSEEAVELLVGAAFQGPSTAPAIGSRITGFLAFLHLVASHPWRATPLLVDPSQEVQQEQRRTLQAEFEALRQAGTAPAMFIATPYDLQTSRWTHRHPSSLVASHFVALARTAHQTLSQLLLLGADAPLVQQQLLLLQQDEQQAADIASADTHKRSKQQQAGDSSGLRKLESRALGRTWRALCAPVLTGFDALILLRKEALPFADRVDPLAAQQLATLVTQQHRQQRRLAGGKQQQQQQHGGLQLLLGGSGGGGGVRCAAPKNARAILRSIPEQVLMTKPADKLRSELLVGFDPVTLYLSLLTQRYGHLAQFCADSSSGFPAIGIKWHPAAFLPAHLKPNVAHAQMEICATGAGAGAGAGAGTSAGKGGKGSSSSRKGLVVPNLPQVLCEAAEMGLGLVEELLVL